MHPNRRWTISDPHPDALQLADRLRTSPLIAQVLLNRGMADVGACHAFMRPSLKALHEPGLIPNLNKAAERIAQAIRDKQRIFVYGDYDVDGITATTILWHAIRVLGGNAEFYIPHRIEEGYGLNAEALKQLCDQGAQLIITVDCGVTAVEPSKVPCERGVDLIITDHHEWHDAVAEDGTRTPKLPGCYTVVHPRLPGDGPGYPNLALCGAGVAFKLAWGIGQAMNGGAKVTDEFKQFLLEATALAALGTIADVVPLTGENRILAHFGLSGLKASKLTGIKALIASANLTGQKLDSYHVGFLLAPRLNACGRMGHARLAVEMLTKADEAQANEIATYLEQQNKARQVMEKKILEQALQQVTDLHMDADDCRGLVLGYEGWHAGVIGIVASRIVERFNKPTVMVALNNGTGQGSARSIAGFHMSRAFEACSRHLEGYGGHEMAAGLKLKAENFENFREAFREYACGALTPEQMVPELKLETLAELRQITLPLVQDLQRLGPFGHGNRKPLLCIRDLEIAATPRRVGKTGDHLQIQVRQGNSVMKAIAFNYGAMFDRLQQGTRIDLAVEPTINEFNGYTNVELAVKDLQFGR
jgi:single-stranded-DNA-specific exonuclease